MMTTRLAVVFSCTLVLLCGCGGEDKWKKNRPKTVPASGTITLNGKPLVDAQVVLVPTTGTTGCSGKSDEKGAFELAAFAPDPGVVPGSYKVMIVKSEIPASPDPNAPESNKAIYAKLLVPVKYTDPEKSGLTVDIPEAGKKDIKFELKD